MACVVHGLAALATLGVAFTAAGMEPPYKPGGVYPSRPVRLIVPHAPGARTDTVARLMARARS